MPEPQLREALNSLGSNIARAVEMMPTHEARLKAFAPPEPAPAH
jgi:hypothetical protein